MAIKKSELYALIWSSCDELRGGMDASQYKDYVLSLLFIKFISDKYDGVPYAPINIPKGASFADMIALKGKRDIGDQINKKIIVPLASANDQLPLAYFPDFNAPEKLGDDNDIVHRLTNLISIFQNPALDFSKNHADGDDVLGDAYEYLMRHFATESGKSKGQFYTPAEVSRVMAQVLNIKSAKTSPKTSVYDPTCGSGSLLLKVAAEARTAITLYGQQKDLATSGLARMNMILHNNPTAMIVQGNTLSDPKYFNKNALKTFDYVVANPPFSDKRWSTGVEPQNDYYGRFESFGVPPERQGDYAYLLHIIRSLKPTGQGACILPHGVLFRGNAEANIRRKLIQKGYIRGVIGLPANLFYGTSIPACIVVIDKTEAQARKGIFMVDASHGFIKDGAKNCLRSQDIHKLVDVFIKHLELPGYSRMVSHEEIEKNEFNLNIPRYIDGHRVKDKQDIEGHLKGGIPADDIDALHLYWKEFPSLKSNLFTSNRKGYVSLAVDKDKVQSTILENHELVAFIKDMNAHFESWSKRSAKTLKQLAKSNNPKDVIFNLSEDLLIHYTNMPLIDKYDVYQHLLNYWIEVMQDDCHLISSDGWNAITDPPSDKSAQSKVTRKGWTCDLIPKELIVARYFPEHQAAIDQLKSNVDEVNAKLTEMQLEHGGEGGALSEMEKINKGNVIARVKAIMNYDGVENEVKVLKNWLELSKELTQIKRQIKKAEDELDFNAYMKYPDLNEEETKMMVVDDKWLTTVDRLIQGEMDRICQSLAQRVWTLAKRYEQPLSVLVANVASHEAKVKANLAEMGFSW